MSHAKTCQIRDNMNAIPTRNVLSKVSKKTVGYIYLFKVVVACCDGNYHVTIINSRKNLLNS